MNHLTEEQISHWFAGGGTAEEERHLHECSICKETLAEFEIAISAFRDAASSWAGESIPRVPEATDLISASRHSRRNLLRWSLASAILVILALMPMYRISVEPQRTREAAAPPAPSDEELLHRINAHLSQTAPASLLRLELSSKVNGNVKEGDRQ